MDDADDDLHEQIEGRTGLLSSLQESEPLGRELALAALSQPVATQHEKTDWASKRSSAL